MKKFIMSKVDNSDGGSPPQSTGVALPSPEPAPEEKSTIHPPLPVDPPLSPLRSPKKEIIEEETEDNVDESTEAVEPMIAIENIKNEESSKPLKPICRDFIRGTCSRIGTCRYNHDRDLSQLKGVYTFCHNFQNKQCTHPKCKYVHATVPEQETFFRTGYLPPHTLAHHKALVPPPPPPPPAHPDTNHNETQSKISVKPPSVLQGIEKSPSTAPVACLPISNGILTKANDALLDDLKNTANENWGDMRDDGNDGKAESPCETCDVKENRLQHAKDKFDELLETASATNRKTNHLDEKLKRIMFLNKATGFLSGDQQQIELLQMVGLLNNMVARHG